MVNYIKILTLSPFKCAYAYFDTNEYHADQLFIKHKVSVKVKNEYTKEGSRYCVIYCKIRKKDEQAFLEALSEMENKMILLGYDDYPDFCKMIMDAMEAARNGSEKETCEAD